MITVYVLHDFLLCYYAVVVQNKAEDAVTSVSHTRYLISLTTETHIKTKYFKASPSSRHATCLHVYRVFFFFRSWVLNINKHRHVRVMLERESGYIQIFIKDKIHIYFCYILIFFFLLPLHNDSVFFRQGKELDRV